MKHFYLFVIVVLCLSCSKNPKEYLKHVNGYWEIKKVEFKDGTVKSYTFNETIDYIKINDTLMGFRKKLKPTFNNTYIASNDAEGVSAKIENDSLNLYYKTPYSQRKETVLFANDNELKIINTNKDVYIYNRFKGLKLNIE